MPVKMEQVSHIYMQGGPFESTAILDIDLEIQDGEFIGLIGHTGSGKSTLIQHLNGLLKPTQGTVIVNEIRIEKGSRELRAVRQQVGLVFQYPEHQLFEETVRRDIAFAPTNMGLSKEEIEERVEQACALVGISKDILDKSPFEISGGQKRRVAIAGVLAMKPQVLVLDEPTAGLDPRGREEILSQIKKLHKDIGITVILVSHGMEDIANTVERLFVMNKGKIAMEGTPLEVYSRYEELEEIGLSAPQVTKLMKRLFNVNVCTVAQAKEYLMGVLKRA